MQSYKVMLVEDVKMIRTLIRHQLGELGITEIVMASDGAEALELLLREPGVDVILCDWHMEPMDGLSFCGQVQATAQLRGRRVPVVFMTSDDRLADPDKRRRTLETAKAIGIVGMLTKPFSTDDLRAMLIRSGGFDPLRGAFE